MLVGVTFVLLTNLAGASPRKMSGWDFPTRRQTETTGKTPILLTTTRYSQVTVPIFFLHLGGPLRCTMTPAFLLPPLLLAGAALGWKSRSVIG